MTDEPGDAQRVHIELTAEAGWVVSIDVVVPEADWSLRAWQEDGKWHVIRRDDEAGAHVGAWPQVFDLFPETLAGAPVAAEVGDRVDRDGQLRPAGRSLMRRELTAGLDQMQRLYGERAVAGWLAEEAGKRGLRLSADPEMPDELRGPGFQAASADPERNPA